MHGRSQGINSVVWGAAGALGELKSPHIPLASPASWTFFVSLVPRREGILCSACGTSILDLLYPWCLEEFVLVAGWAPPHSG